MFIQYLVRLVYFIQMRVALFNIRLLRKSVSNIRGPITVTGKNIRATAPAPTRLQIK